MLPPKEQMEQMRKEQEERFQEPTAVPQNFGGFGPPAFDDDDTSVYNNDELENTYKKFGGSELEPEFDDNDVDDVDDVDDDDDNDIPGFGFVPPPDWGTRNRPPETESLRAEGGAFLRDETIFPGGPTRTEVMSWKKQFETDGHVVNLTEIGDDVFIWRTLNRLEYREIMALPNSDPLQREEIICEVVVLFPYEYNFTSMANRKAGVPAVLAEEAMRESGFRKPAPPVRL